MTSSPSFEEPERTPPFLLGPSARPDLRRVRVVQTTGVPDPIEFSATVRSEDNGADVLGRLVLDYGVRPIGGPPEQPFHSVLREAILPASTLDDTSRTLSVQWFPGTNPPENGCHTVSLFATHKIDVDSGCPADPTDFDFLTWTIIACDGIDGSCCDPTLPEEQGGCSSFQCPVVDPDARCEAVAPAGTGSGGIR